MYICRIKQYQIFSSNIFLNLVFELKENSLLKLMVKYELNNMTCRFIFKCLNEIKIILDFG